MTASARLTRRSHVGFVALACLALLAGCAGTWGSTDTPPGDGPDVGVPVTEYETFVFDLGPSPDPAIAGGIAVEEEFDERYYVTLLTTESETERFDRSLLPPDAGAFVDDVDFDREQLVVIQAFPASSVPDYRVESVARDGPTLHVSIDDASDGGTDDVTVETLLLRLPGETTDNVIVATEDGETFEIGGES